MVRTQSADQDYQVLFTNGTHFGVADTTEDKGGNNSGLGPHDLLEAAFASCLNIWVRMYAANHGLPPPGVETRVFLDRSHPDEVVFEYDVTITGELSGLEKSRLLQVAQSCPVHRTLSKKISFKPVKLDPAV